MTNYPFQFIEDFRDVESINAYRELTQNGVIPPEDMLKFLCYKSRDNARTPVQWDDSTNAGFTTGTPWIGVNPNYREINAAQQRNREDSVFRFYQKLIRLRHENEIIAYGRYELILPDDPQLFAYTREWEGRKLLVACNLTGKAAQASLPQEIACGKLLISNYDDVDLHENMALRPWEAFAVLQEDGYKNGHFCNLHQSGLGLHQCTAGAF